MHKLNNNHNVYILGAGFSAERGLPTIKDFMLAMRDASEWLESEGRYIEAKAISEVLKFRLDAASAAYRIKLDLENIEELFSLASAKSITHAKYIQLAIAATLDYKLKILKEPTVHFSAQVGNEEIPVHWTHDAPNEAGYAQFSCPAYEFYLKAMLGDRSIPCRNRNTFITFNYDLLLENALRNLSIPYTYGINTQESSLDNNIEVLKLHGSINWARKSNSNKSYTIFNSYNELLEAGQTPQLLPPTWRKLFSGPLLQVWDRSLRSLEQATRIIVIGFSIPPTDHHFKYLIAAGLQNNILLREIVFVDPEISHIEERAKNLFSDITRLSSVKFIQYTTSKFMSIGTEYHEQSIRYFGRPIPHFYQGLQQRNPN